MGCKLENCTYMIDNIVFPFLYVISIQYYFLGRPELEIVFQERKKILEKMSKGADKLCEKDNCKV